jgi:hypothetical protein
MRPASHFAGALALAFAPTLSACIEGLLGPVVAMDHYVAPPEAGSPLRARPGFAVADGGFGSDEVPGDGAPPTSGPRP